MVNVDGTSSTSGVSETSETDNKTREDREAKYGDTVVKNMEQLKTEAPEILEEMLKAMGMEMCEKMKKGQERIKKARIEAERQ